MSAFFNIFQRISFFITSDFFHQTKFFFITSTTPQYLPTQQTPLPDILPKPVFITPLLDHLHQIPLKMVGVARLVLQKNLVELFPDGRVEFVKTCFGYLK